MENGIPFGIPLFLRDSACRTNPAGKQRPAFAGKTGRRLPQGTWKGIRRQMKKGEIREGIVEKVKFPNKGCVRLLPAEEQKEEKAEYRAAQLEKELAELKRQNAITAMRSEARKMLDEQGINLPDDLIQNIVVEDADTTKTNVEAFAKAYKEAVQAGVKEALKGNTPQASRSDTKGITKEQILAVKDRGERQKLMAEHPELFARR